MRRSATRDGEADRLSAADTNVNSPKTPTIQAPIDIGSQTLRVRIMLRNRVGTPRSAIRRSPQTATSGSDSR